MKNGRENITIDLLVAQIDYAACHVTSERHTWALHADFISVLHVHRLSKRGLSYDIGHYTVRDKPRKAVSIESGVKHRK